VFPSSSGRWLAEVRTYKVEQEIVKEQNEGIFAGHFHFLGSFCDW